MSGVPVVPAAASFQELLGRLRVRVRLLLLGLIAVVLAGIPAAMQWREVQRSIGQAELGAQGIAPVRSLLDLIQLVQQHRGLTVLALFGDVRDGALRADRQTQIDAAFASMAAGAARARGDDFEQIEWNDAKAAWLALRQRVAPDQVSATDAITGHSALIAHLLDMVDRLSHRHALPLDPERDTHLLTDVGISMLPRLAEELARARSEGVVRLMAGTGHDLAVANAWGELAHGASANVLRSMQEFIVHRPAVATRLTGPLHEAVARTEAALHSVGAWQRGGLPREAVTIHYAIFTEAIDAVLALDHAVLGELQGLLSERVRMRQREVATMFGAMCALLALGTWLGLRVSRSITRQIGAEPADIVRLTETIGMGCLDTDIVVGAGAERSILAAMARMQQALQSSELRYAELIESMPVGVLIVRDQQVRLANAMAAQMQGTSADQMVGDAPAGWVREDDRARVHVLFAEAASGGPGPTVTEVWVVRPDGEHRHWRLRVQPVEWEGRSAHLVTLGDITEYTLAERRHRELSSIVEQTSDAIMLASADGTIQYVNPGFERLTGYRSDEVLGRTPSMFKSGRHDEHFYRQLWSTIRAGRTFHAQVVNRHKDGSEYHAIKTITPMLDAQGRLVSFVNIDKDFSDQHAAQARLAQLALQDPLTGLANRALLEDHVREAIARNQRADEPFALLFIDLDGFKAVNDRQGHRAGDAVLQEVGHRLQAHTRETDTAARLGGDEFVLLLQGVADVETAEKIADKLVQAIGAPIVTESGAASVGASVGIALYPQDGHSVQALLDQADVAMYRAKRAGGRRIRRADAATAPRPSRHGALEGVA